MLDAAKRAPTRRGWGPAHWRAIILTTYDTALRVGATLQIPPTAYDPNERTLFVDAKFQKGGADTIHAVADDTHEAIMAIRDVGRDRLFVWPSRDDYIQPSFRRFILKPAGLPHSRKHMFHALRRTSYTQVYINHGLQAASEHASHTSDLSAAYLDRTKVADRRVIHSLPRPSVELERERQGGAA